MSKIYDFSREKENTGKWSEFISYALKECNINEGSRVLDCGCGTGDISIFMAKTGLMVDAIDISADMLMIAKEKTHNLGLHINYTLQDMRRFKSHGKYSMITCINDGVNYLTSAEDVKMFFSGCFNHLENKGFLLFDISTLYKLKNMDGQFFAEEDDDFAYLWYNEFDDNKKTLTMDLTFFTQVEDDMFRRSNEVHIQKAYSSEQIQSLLKECGFLLNATYSDISPEKPKDKSERIHFLAQKP